MYCQIVKLDRKWLIKSKEERIDYIFSIDNLHKEWNFHNLPAKILQKCVEITTRYLWMKHKLTLQVIRGLYLEHGLTKLLQPKLPNQTLCASQQ